MPFILATWLVLALRVAGFCGLDDYGLPLLGAPRGADSDVEARRRRPPARSS